MKGLKILSIDPDGMDQNILDQAWALVKTSGINILSDKTLGGVAMLGNKVVGALFVPEYGQKYGFDIIVHPQYQRQGIGMQLAQLGKSMYDPEQYPEGMEMDAVSPGGRRISEKMGLQKAEEIGEHWLYRKPEAQAWVLKNCRFAQTQIKTALPALAPNDFAESTKVGWDALMERFPFEYGGSPDHPKTSDDLTERWDTVHQVYQQKHGLPEASPEEKTQHWNQWRRYVLAWYEEHKNENLENVKPGVEKPLGQSISAALRNAWYKGIEIPVYFIDKAGEFQLKRITRPGKLPPPPQLDLDSEAEHWLSNKQAQTWVRSNCRFAQAQVSFNNAPLLALVEKNLGYLQQSIEERQGLTATPFDISAYQKNMGDALAQVPEPLAGMIKTEFGSIVSMYQAGNIDGARDAIADTIHKIIAVDFQKQHNANWGMIRAAYKILTNLDEHIYATVGQHAPMEQDMAEYRAELMKDYNKAMAQVADVEARLKTFAQASGRNDVSFRIAPNFSENWETKSLVMYPLNFTVDVVFAAEGRDEFPPNVTLFAEEKDGAVTGYTADDVLSWGDTDFFADASQSKFYFELIDYIKTGKLPTERGTKFIRLHRGMSTNEYALWERGETIPAGKFFTKDRTAEKAMDISGEFPELYSFSVREDVVVDVGDNNYQTSVPTRMVNKKIVPLQQAQAWVRANCRFAQAKKEYHCVLYVGSRKVDEDHVPRLATSEQEAEVHFWHHHTKGRPWKIDDLKRKNYTVRCVEVPPMPPMAPRPVQTKPKQPQQGTLFDMSPDPFKR